jgi:DNA-binding MarR family transcriptional regulator
MSTPVTSPTASAGANALDHTELRAWSGFLRAHARLIAELDQDLLGAHGLPLRSYDVLLQLAQAGGRRLRMSELADAVVLSRSGLTRLVDRLERQGYVERRPCPSDARGSLAALTPLGLRRLRDSRATHLAAIRRLFLSHFDQRELETMGDFADRILQAPRGV